MVQCAHGLCTALCQPCCLPLPFIPSCTRSLGVVELLANPDQARCGSKPRPCLCRLSACAHGSRVPRAAARSDTLAQPCCFDLCCSTPSPPPQLAAFKENPEERAPGLALEVSSSLLKMRHRGCDAPIFGVASAHPHDAAGRSACVGVGGDSSGRPTTARHVQLPTGGPQPGPTPNAQICRYHSASALALRRVALEDVQVGRAGPNDPAGCAHGTPPHAWCHHSRLLPSAPVLPDSQYCF